MGTQKHFKNRISLHYSLLQSGALRSGSVHVSRIFMDDAFMFVSYLHSNKGGGHVF